MVVCIDALLNDRVLLHLAMDNNPNLIFVKDREFRFEYANQALLELYAPEQRHQVIGYTTVEQFPKEVADVFLREDRKAFDEGSTALIEEIHDHQGRPRTFHTRKYRFTSEDGQTRILGISADITEQAARERELVQTNKMLADFASVSAHDLRSPLSTFVTSVDYVMSDKETRLGPDSAEFLTMMRQSAHNLLRHINGLLKTYKAAKGEGAARAETDLNILFKEVQYNLSDLARQNGALLLSNRLPVMEVDPDLLRHLLHNLIENSIKYRSAEPPVVILRYDEAQCDHCFSVEDNGKGLSQAEEEKLFRRDEGETASAKGFGIGLSLCRKIIELHEGKIWVDRAYTKGCRIVFTLPHPKPQMMAAV